MAYLLKNDGGRFILNASGFILLNQVGGGTTGGKRRRDGWESGERNVTGVPEYLQASPVDASRAARLEAQKAAMLRRRDDEEAFLMIVFNIL